MWNRCTGTSQLEYKFEIKDHYVLVNINPYTISCRQPDTRNFMGAKPCMTDMVPVESIDTNYTVRRFFLFCEKEYKSVLVTHIPVLHVHISHYFRTFVLMTSVLWACITSTKMYLCISTQTNHSCSPHRGETLYYTDHIFCQYSHNNSMSSTKRVKACNPHTPKFGLQSYTCNYHRRNTLRYPEHAEMQTACNRTQILPASVPGGLVKPCMHMYIKTA